MASSLNHSVARTIPVVLGISAGFAFMLLAVGIGLGAAIRVNASLNTATKAFGFAYTLWLAWKVATSAPTLRGFRQRRETGVGIHGRDVPVGQPVYMGFRVLGDRSLHRDGRAVCQSRLERIDLSRGGDFIAQRVGRVRQLFLGLIGSLARCVFNVAMAVLLVARASPVALEIATDISSVPQRREFSRHLRLHSEVVSLFSDAC